MGFITTGNDIEVLDMDWGPHSPRRFQALPQFSPPISTARRSLINTRSRRQAIFHLM